MNKNKLLFIKFIMKDNFPRKEFKLKGKDNRLYNLTLIKEEDEITFKSNEINNIWNIEYVLSININKFYNINKSLSKYNSINEIYSKYFNDIKEEQISISSNDNKIIVNFSDNDIVGIPFILEPNEMKINDIIRKLCDKMKDIDALKTELDKQKIENDNLRNELIKRRKDDEKNISEIRKEIENLKKEINNISQKELYDNKLEYKAKEINQVKKDIEKLDKKKYSEYKEINEKSNKNEFSILGWEKDLESINEVQKKYNEKNTTKNEMNNFNNKLICENDKFNGINVQNPDETKFQNQNKELYGNNNLILKEDLDFGNFRYQLEFEQNEIKLNLNTKKARFFDIRDIKITNRSNKSFKYFYMIIDMNTSSKNLYFYYNERNPTIHLVIPPYPLLTGESFSSIFSFYINQPKIGEYTIYIYLKEKLDGDNLSSPLKICVNLIEDPENIERKEEKEKEKKKKEKEDYFKREENIKRIQEENENVDYKGVDKIKVEEMLNVLDDEYGITSMFYKEDVINKIIEFNCDRQKIDKWIQDSL